MSKGHLDVAAGGAFLSLTTDGATALIGKMVANQGWGEDRTPAKTQKGMHTVKEMDLLAAKIDLLLKKFDERATDINTSTVKAMDSQMTCEVCGCNTPKCLACIYAIALHNISAFISLSHVHHPMFQCCNMMLH
jgi:hypothetical protein